MNTETINELADAPTWGLRDAERVIQARLSRDNALLTQVRKEMRRRERQQAYRDSRAQSDDKSSTDA